MIYSFDLSNFESGRFTATRYPASCAVSGDWICSAQSDDEALERALAAAAEEWLEPQARHWSEFTVEFVDSHRMTEGGAK